LITKQIFILFASLTILVLSLPSFAQDANKLPLSHYSSASVPIANNLPDPRVIQPLPDAPSAIQNSGNIAGPNSKGSSFYAEEKPRRFLTHAFLGGNAVFLASIIYDVEMTHQGLAHHRCVEDSFENPYPSRADLYKKDLILFAGLTAMDLLLKKAGDDLDLPPFVTAMGGNMGAIIGTLKHVHGGTHWATQCW